MNEQEKHMAWLAVLDEQSTRTMFNIGKRNDEAISEAYMAISKHCRVLAYNTGFLDQTTISEILEESASHFKKAKAWKEKQRIGRFLRMLKKRSTQ